MTKKLLLSLALIVFASTAWGDEAQQTNIFVKPDPIKRRPPIYPLKEVRSENAGLVEVDFMVDENGRTFEPLVTRSTDKLFEKSALKAISKYEFKPGTRDGKPVASRSSIRLLFEIRDSQDRVNVGFAHAYRAAAKQFAKEAPDQAKLDRYIRKMKRTTYLTPYALSRLSVIEAKYANEFGDIHQRIEAIRSLLVMDKRVNEKNRALDAQDRIDFQSVLFGDLLRTQRFQEALPVYAELIKMKPSLRKDYRKYIRSIYEFKSATDQVASVAIRLTDRGNAIEELSKRIFAYDEVVGKIEILKLRCDAKFKELPFQADVEYRIPKSWGQCQLETIGEAGTTAKLLQT